MNYKTIVDKEALLSEIAENPSNIQFAFNGDAEEIIEIMHKNGYFLDRSSRVPDDNALFKFLKAEPKTLRDNYFCPGCGACVNICPNDALKWKGDEYGYYRPLLDNDKCINCGKCTASCPVINPINNENTLTPDCYEFIANDDEILKKSSSGGVFSLLALEILKTGGLISGVAWREDFSVEHILIDKEEDLQKLQKSKYMQSDVGFVYRSIKKHLEDGKNVLFSGCPCHVAGLRSYLGNEYGNLYTVDLLCSQAPSAEFFKKYINDTFRENKIQSYEFRHKLPSWNRDCDTHKIWFLDGTSTERSYKDDPFQHVFHKKIMSSDACNWCSFSTIPRPADITIGDFWGIENYDWENIENFKKGISVALLNNKKGLDLFELIMTSAGLIKKSPLEWLGGNGNLFIKRKGKRDEYRDMFYNLYKRLPFAKAADAASMTQFDIGLVGCWNAANYGALLTYYALNKVLLDLGYSVLMIKNCLRYTEKDCMIAFAKKHFFYNIYNNKTEYLEYNNICKIFMTGCDQIWNYRLLWANEDFFLNFVDGDKVKLAYGTSFGMQEHEPSGYDKLRRSFLLQRFDAISVREDYAVDIAKEIYNIDSEQVLDPVFFLEKEDYIPLINEATFNYNKDFIGAYILDATPEKRERLIEVSKLLNMDIVIILGMGETLYNDKEIQKNYKNLFYDMIVLDDPSPENFLYIFYNSKFIITDSFHGVCFSYIFRKDFLVFYNVGRGLERFYSLMRILKLEDRRIYENECISNEKAKKIDFSIAESNINKIKEKSLYWLENSLKIKNKNAIKDYDFIKYDLEEINKKIDNTSQQINDMRIVVESAVLPLKGKKGMLALHAMKETDLLNYLRLLSILTLQFLVIISIKNPRGKRINKEIINGLNESGFKIKTNSLFWRNYIGIINNGEKIYEEFLDKNEPLLYEKRLKNNNLKVRSEVGRERKDIYIKINDIDYSVNEDGINIVVYDNNNFYIDSVCFETDYNPYKCSRGSTEKWIMRFSARADTYRNYIKYRSKIIVHIKKNYWEKITLFKKFWKYYKMHSFNQTIKKIIEKFNHKGKL